MDNSKVQRFSIVDTNTIKIPAYEENTNTKGYVYWGSDNMFPQFVNMLYNESATVRAIVDGSANYIIGNGLVVGERLAKFREKCNRNGETLADVCEQLSVDLMKMNGFAIQVIYDKLGTIAEIYALDVTRCRLSADGRRVYYASKWGQYTSKYKEYGIFDRSSIDPSNPTQIYFFKGAARTVYPRPRWEGAFRDALAEISASKFVLNSMANGLAAKTLITFPNDTGLLTEEEKTAIEEAVKAKFTGPDADSSFMIFFREQGMSELKVDSIQQQDEAPRFINLKKSARENIFTAFCCSPNIFGLANNNSGVFSKDSYNDAFSLYNKTQIKPRQRQIERAFDKLFGSKDTISFIPFTLEDDNQTQN